jgi:hypothetical protein
MGQNVDSYLALLELAEPYFDRALELFKYEWGSTAKYEWLEEKSAKCLNALRDPSRPSNQVQ